MNWRQYLFSFQGRVGRQQYWWMILLSLPFIAAAFVVNGGLEGDPTDYPGILLLLPPLWPTAAVSIKRWHDRNKSGWWILIGLIPIVGDIWVLVENGFLRGTPGDNRFGPEPLAQKP
jgi:uncharacterized membrane protein YhaH (DUF805 family)